MRGQGNPWVSAVVSSLPYSESQELETRGNEKPGIAIPPGHNPASIIGGHCVHWPFAALI